VDSITVGRVTSEVTAHCTLIVLCFRIVPVSDIRARSKLILPELTGLSASVADQLILSAYRQLSEAGVILEISVLLFASGRCVWSKAWRRWLLSVSNPTVRF